MLSQHHYSYQYYISGTIILLDEMDLRSFAITVLLLLLKVPLAAVKMSLTLKYEEASQPKKI